MNVVMVNTFHHRRGGDATYALTLSAALRQRGHRVVPLAMRHPDNDPSEWERWFVPQVDFNDLDRARSAFGAARRSVFNGRAARCAAALYDRVKPDVVHLNSVHHHLTPSIVWPARKRGIPVVWTVHDYELICPAGHLFSQGGPCEACKGHRYHQAVLRRCKRDGVVFSAFAALENRLHVAAGLWDAVDAWLSPSRFLAGRLVDFGMDAARVHHLPNFVELPTAGDGPGEGWLYAGRLSEEKGVWVLLEAARRVDAQLTICGDGPLRGWLEAAAPPNVRFVGHLPPAELAGRIRAAAVVVVPSIWYENFPYAVLEAQGAGRAVVASRIGGIPEQITHAEDGLLVPAGDPDALAATVRGLLVDPDRRTELGRRGRARVACLDVQPHVDAVEHHYRAVS